MTRLRAWQGIVLAAACSAAALALTALTAGALGGRRYFIALAAVAVVSLLGGAVAGVVSIALLTLGFNVPLGLSPATLGFPQGHHLYQTVSFVVVAALLAAISVAARRHQRGEAVALRRLDESESRFRTMVQNVRDHAIFMLAPDATVASWNAGAERLKGYAEAEILGRNYEIFFPPEDVAAGKPARLLAEARAGGEAHDEGWRVRKDGQRFYASVSVSTLRGPGGEVTGYTKVVHDITEQHEARLERERVLAALRESEERFRHLIDSSAIGLVIGDETGRLSYVNDVLLQLLGYPADAVASGELRWDVLTPPEHHPRDAAAIAALRATGKAEPYEKEYLTKEGRRIPVLLGVVPIGHTDEGGLQLAAYVVDLTARKRAEDALMEANRRKDEFLGVLSHELRNPLAPIRNALYVLDRAPAGSAQAQRSTAIIARQVDHLARLVDDLLDVTRIARGKIQLRRERVDVGDVARRVVEDHRELFRRRDIRLELQERDRFVTVDGDPTRVAQVLGNLLMNAAKFTDRGGSVVVSVARDAGEAVLTVRDSGVGIPPQLLGRLFEPFTQADESLHRTEGGLGLGLALVKGLVELHGGSIHVASGGAGLGSEFTVTLPLARGAATPGVARVQSLASASRRRVLIVEDNVDAADTLREVLELDGHVVEVAYDGRTGVDKARTFAPDIVLCDIGLPEIDGYGVARAIRAHDASGRTVLVALTGYARPEDQRRAAEAGFTQHLSKPVSREQLESVLRRASAQPIAQA